MRTQLAAIAGLLALALAISTAGIASAQTEAVEDAEPTEATAVATEPTSPTFPTGLFVWVETGRVLLEYHGDGTGLTHSATYDTATPLTYAVEGDVYTAVKGPWDTVLGVALADVDDPSGPATYHWGYDGERLAFEPMGEDPSERRGSLLQNHTFRAIEEPVAVMAATFDLDVGDPIRAWLAFVPAAEAGPDAYTSKTEYLGQVAAVPISRGQPITPDLLQAAAE